MKRKFTKLTAALALLATLCFPLGMWGQTYEALVTFDCADASNNGTQSLYGQPTASLTAAYLKAFLNAAAGETAVTSTSSISNVYWTKGSGGSVIPDDVLKIGKASAAGSFTFVIPDSYDQISKVSISGYGWKNTTAVSVNGSAAQTTSNAATLYTFDYVLTAATRTITISVSSSAFCATEIVLYKTTGGSGGSNVTITYSANGTTSTTSVAPGDITLLPGSDLNNNFTFAGWTTKANDLTNILPANSTKNVQGDSTFYAVYAHTVNVSGGGRYEKVTETPESWEGVYLIVAEDTYANGTDFQVALDGSLQTLDATNNYIDVTINDGVIASSSTVDAATFTIEEILDSNDEVTGYSIQSASGFYIGNVKTGSNKNGLSADPNTVYSNDIFFDNDELIIEASNGTYMRFNKNLDQKRFRYFSSGQTEIQLYKYVAGNYSPEPYTTTAYYTRVFLGSTNQFNHWYCTPGANLSITGPSIVPSGHILDMASYTLANSLGNDRLIIEDGAEVICDNAFYGTMQKNIVGTDFSANPAGGYYLIASPLEGLDLTVTDANMIPWASNQPNVNATTYDLYKYDAAALDGLEWVNFKVGNHFTLDGYEGYLYANAANTMLCFAGLLNDRGNMSSLGGGEILLAYEADDNYLKRLTLVGNSGTSETTFMMYDDNDDEVSFAYLKLNDAGDGYGSYVSDGMVDVAPLEGIFVLTPYDPEDPEVEYYLSNAEESTFSGSNQQPSNVDVRINRVNGEFIDNAIVSFSGIMMRKLYLNNASTRVYFPVSNQDYSVLPAENEGEMPVNFKAKENGTYVISVDVNNIEMNYLHLIDNMTGADVDLLTNPSYTFSASTNDYAYRFRLVFSASDVEENTVVDNFAYYNGSEWVVTSDGTLEVVDVMGRVLSTETISGNTALNINQPTGIYMLRLVNGNSVRVQKIVVR